METAEAAGVQINFVVGDVLEIDLDTYGETFDVVFMEGGILHYFHDLNEFMRIMYRLLKPGGKMICSDFHPFTKIYDSLHLGIPSMGYFFSDVYEGEMAQARFYEEPIRSRIPKCRYRKYTVSEIINAIINTGFRLQRFDEHPAWEDEKLEMAAIADIPVWFADYSSKPQSPYCYDFWQYTSKGKVDGIEGRVDLNIQYR